MGVGNMIRLRYDSLRAKLWPIMAMDTRLARRQPSKSRRQSRRSSVHNRKDRRVGTALMKWGAAIFLRGKRARCPPDTDLRPSPRQI